MQRLSRLIPVHQRSPEVLKLKLAGAKTVHGLRKEMNFISGTNFILKLILIMG